MIRADKIADELKRATIHEGYLSAQAIEDYKSWVTDHHWPKHYLFESMTNTKHYDTVQSVLEDRKKKSLGIFQLYTVEMPTLPLLYVGFIGHKQHPLFRQTRYNMAFMSVPLQNIFAVGDPKLDEVFFVTLGVEWDSFTL